MKKANYLVCVNFEEYSEIALHYACYLAKISKGSVSLLHVLEPVDYQTIGMVAEKMRQEQYKESQNKLNDLAGKAQKWSGIIPVVIVKEGLIESEIIKAIEEDENITMLITGVSHQSSKKSKVIHNLVAIIGPKIDIPMLIVPDNLNKEIFTQ